MNRTIVENHNQVEWGDVLIHVEQEGKDPVSYKVSTSNWFTEMVELFQLHFTDAAKTTIRLVMYDSVLKQRLLKEVTMVS